jgi:hypothetical protein
VQMHTKKMKKSIGNRDIKTLPSPHSETDKFHLATNRPKYTSCPVLSSLGLLSAQLAACC